MVETNKVKRGAAVWRIVIWGGAAALWLAPMAAMRFTREVNWTAMDFAVFGAMLLAACGACEVALRASGSLVYRLGAAVAVGTGFLLVWACLAVGFIGSEGNPDNLVYGGVLGLGVVGAFVSRMQARGLAMTLTVMAAAQAATLLGRMAGWDVPVAPTVVFTVLWLVAAGLFAAARR